MLPDPIDVYAGRNIRTILALLTLANHLFRLRKCPPIRDQTGNVRVTGERNAAKNRRALCRAWPARPKKHAFCCWFNEIWGGNAEKGHLNFICRFFSVLGGLQDKTRA